MKVRHRLYAAVLLVLAATAAAQTAVAPAPAAAPRFEIWFAASAHAQPITGRVYVIITRRSSPEPRLQVGSWTQETPFFGADVSQLKPGEPAVIDANTLGYPLASLKDIPAGDYYVQGLMNVYTEFHRADGHTIWAHMDQWEGQQFNESPGNLYSQTQQVHLDPAGYNVKLQLTEVIPPVKVPPDTKWVKRIKFQSALLSKFWGRPIYLGATVLLPKDYDQHPTVRYPVIYEQDHFSLRAPLQFRDEQEGRGNGRWGEQRERLYRDWTGPNFPRVIAVTFQHPTPYFDDSYAVNSANNGPYGDAIMRELIPYIEERFRIIREPWARVLTGGSTGGWESLALQVFHPEFFGGTFTFYPDPIDFRRYQLIDIYSDENAFYAPGFEWVPRERPLMRTAEGQVVVTMKQMSQLEEVLGARGRSGQQIEAWEAVYGPVGPDGYPKPLWNKLTGKIDRDVAHYMRDHGYDLRAYLEKNWQKIGPQLTGKIHIYCGDMDNFYLNLAVYQMEEFLESTKSPAAKATFEYGRPVKGHGWSPYTLSELVTVIADYIAQQAPAGADVKRWKY
ncbi:MAG: alpha/beta hydrolase-fold protein [Terriglobales bacterium]